MQFLLLFQPKIIVWLISYSGDWFLGFIHGECRNHSSNGKPCLAPTKIAFNWKNILFFLQKLNCIFWNMYIYTRKILKQRNFFLAVTLGVQLWQKYSTTASNSFHIKYIRVNISYASHNWNYWFKLFNFLLGVAKLTAKSLYNLFIHWSLSNSLILFWSCFSRYFNFLY